MAKKQDERAGKSASSGTSLEPKQGQAPVRQGSVSTGFNPFGMMRRMMDDMDRLFEDFGFGGSMFPQHVATSRGRGFDFTWWPQIDVREHKGSLVVRADLPGMKKEDLSIELTDDGLVLEGERKTETESEEGQVYRSERGYGRFRRVIPLAADAVDKENVQARFTDGVLEVTIPITERKAESKKIEIQSSQPADAGGKGAEPLH